MRSVRTPEGLGFQISEQLEAHGFIAAFTERTGGTSGGPFRSLNLGLRAGDDGRHAAANRRRVAQALGVGGFACVRQIHGARIARAYPGDRDRGFLDPATALDDADGVATDVPGLAVAVLFADCVPIALGDSRGERLAAVHAGWRGLAARILDRAVALFDDPNDVTAAIGPSVGPDHYEVGAEVAGAVRTGTDGAAIVLDDTEAGRPRLDLAGTVEGRLRALGIADVERADGCTACLEARFFSHRRDGTTGRQALLAMRMP